MDHFGIGAAVRAVVRVYVKSARRTGRTTSLVESVQDGDRIVFDDHREATRVEKLLRARGVQVECTVLRVDRAGELFTKPPSAGRTIFDHTWVERYYEQSIDLCQMEIDRLQRETSGFGEAHRETQRAADELLRWKG
jgi:GAF domain-containing protein